MFLLNACHTVQTVSDTTANHLTAHFQRDSVYLHDSIFVHIRADTVYLEKWHTKWRDRIVPPPLLSPAGPVRAISVSAFFSFRQLSRMVCGVFFFGTCV